MTGYNLQLSKVLEPKTQLVLVGGGVVVLPPPLDPPPPQAVTNVPKIIEISIR